MTKWKPLRETKANILQWLPTLSEPQLKVSFQRAMNWLSPSPLICTSTKRGFQPLLKVIIQLIRACLLLVTKSLGLLFAIDFHRLSKIECGGTISQEHGQVMSPNFPNPYLNNADCIWTITSGSGTPMYLKLLVFKVWKFYFILLCTQ